MCKRGRRKGDVLCVCVFFSFYLYFIAGAKDRAKLTPIKQKIEDLLTYLNVPMDVLMAADYNEYRKPCVG